MLTKNELRAVTGAVSKGCDARPGRDYAFGVDYAAQRWVAGTDGHILILAPHADCPLGPVMLDRDGGAKAVSGAPRPPDVAVMIPSRSTDSYSMLEIAESKFAWARKLGRIFDRKNPGVALGLSVESVGSGRVRVSSVLMPGDFASDRDDRPYFDAQLFGRCVMAFEGGRENEGVRVTLDGRLDAAVFSQPGRAIAVVMPLRMRGGYK